MIQTFIKTIYYTVVNYIINYSITTACFTPLDYIVILMIRSHGYHVVDDFNFSDNLKFYSVFALINFLSNIGFSRQELDEDRIILGPWRLLTTILSVIPLSIHLLLWPSYITGKYNIYIGGIIFFFFFGGFLIFLHNIIMQQETTKIIVSDLKYINNCRIVINHFLMASLLLTLYSIVFPKILVKYSTFFSTKENIVLFIISMITILSYMYLQYRYSRIV